VKLTYSSQLAAEILNTWSFSLHAILRVSVVSQLGSRYNYYDYYYCYYYYYN
jgi:hypothetical protein